MNKNYIFLSMICSFSLNYSSDNEQSLHLIDQHDNRPFVYKRTDITAELTTLVNDFQTEMEKGIFFGIGAAGQTFSSLFNVASILLSLSNNTFLPEGLDASAVVFFNTIATSAAVKKYVYGHRRQKEIYEYVRELISSKLTEHSFLSEEGAKNIQKEIVDEIKEQYAPKTVGKILRDNSLFLSAPFSFLNSCLSVNLNKYTNNFGRYALVLNNVLTSLSFSLYLIGTASEIIQEKYLKKNKIDAFEENLKNLLAKYKIDNTNNA